MQFRLSFFWPFRVARRCKPLQAFSTSYRTLQFTPRNTGATPQITICSAVARIKRPVGRTCRLAKDDGYRHPDGGFDGQACAQKVTVVTGASKGIGAEIAGELDAEGALVVVNYATSQGNIGSVVRRTHTTAECALCRHKQRRGRHNPPKPLGQARQPALQGTSVE